MASPVELVQIQPVPPRRTPKPEWIKAPAPLGENYRNLKSLARKLGLHTVCESAQCPNIGECWNHRTATFMLLGDICTRRCGFCAMVAGRIIAPEASKLAMTHAWADTTLAEDLGVADAHEDELYEGMDWLIERQDKIEKRLAKHHLKEGGLVLFDLTSSSFEGVTCPLAKIGYSRDGKPGTLQVNYGLLADSRGCPVAVSVFEGNTADPKTLLPQLEKVRDSFGVASLVMVGDRGMISNVQIEAMRKMEGWTGSPRSRAGPSPRS